MSRRGTYHLETFSDTNPPNCSGTLGVNRTSSPVIDNRERSMSRVMRTTAYAVFGLTLAGLTTASIATAQAGDLYPPAPYGYPAGAPIYERGPEGPCRILLERRVDPYGREIVHRIRMCDDGPVVYPAPHPTVVPEYGYPPRYYEPAPSGYYAPRPPAPIIGSGFYYN